MLKAISLYTGVGGLDFGFEAAGFETAVAIEMDKAACAAIRLNRSWPVIEGDVNEIGSQQILETAGLEVGEADVLIGGPPCQPFSKSGYWSRGDARRLDDPRADTLTAYLRVLRDAQPKAFLLENVHGLAYKGKDEGLRYLLKGIETVNREAGTNYTVTWQKLNAVDYGVPQSRERVFLIGSREGKAFSFPAPTHCPPDQALLVRSGLAPYRTAWDAIGDLPRDVEDPALEVNGKWGDLLPTIPEGWNYLWHTRRGGGEPLFGWRTRYWSFLLKLAKAQPSWTIQAQPGTATGPFHWANRRLTVKELCRLQTFPEDIRLACSRNEAQRLIGNAVPALLAECLGLAMRRQFLEPSWQCQPSLTLTARRPVPDPEPSAALPKKYKHLVGKHDDHPGEGLGRAAIKRKAVAG